MGGGWVGGGGRGELWRAPERSHTREMEAMRSALPEAVRRELSEKPNPTPQPAPTPTPTVSRRRAQR